MKLRRYTVGLAALGAAGSLLLLGYTRADDQESSNLVRLPIQHSRDDGKTLWYQPIGLKNAVVRFYENASLLASMSELLDYDMVRDEAGRLSRFSLTVRPESQKTRPAPPGSQAESLPASSWTVYHDLDGDSVFDTMVQVRPDSMSSFILYQNSWIQVRNAKAKWEKRTNVQALDGRQYYFVKDGWRR